jgi:putative chitinase
MSDPSTLATLEAQALGLLETVRILKAAAAAEVASAPKPAPLAGDVDDPEHAFVGYGRFYDFLRSNKMLGPKITTTEFQGCDAIVRACIRAKWPISYTAYALATAYHETAHTMQPIKEIGGTAYYTRMYDIKGNRPAKAKELGNLTPGDGARYPGRGYVQLTGKKNYALATMKLRELGINVDLVAQPDLAMRPDVAAVILVLGMEEGWFTGRKLPDDLPDNGTASLAQFTHSRDIIKGHDDEALIAGYAVDFQAGLQDGGYRHAA